MSKDKYPSIFSRQMEAIILLSFKYFRNTLNFEKIGEYFSDIFPVLAGTYSLT